MIENCAVGVFFGSGRRAARGLEMDFTRVTPLALPNRIAPFVVLSALSVVAVMQPAPAAEPATAATGTNANSTLEEVIITGTSIKRINAETALPVQVLKQADIARTGATSVEELFRQISS